MSRIIVERRFTEKPDADVVGVPPGASNLDRHQVQFIRCYLSHDRLTMISEYEAPDEAAVRTVLEAAGLPFDSLWTAHVFEWAEEP